MYTNQMRLTGLSGLDTESMISQLMKAESINLQRLRQKKQLLTWKQEAYVSAANSLKAFQSNALSLTSATSLRLSSNLRGFNTTVKSGGNVSSAISVKAETKAVGGAHTLEVFSIAQKAVYQGAALTEKLTSKNTLDANSFAVGDSIRLNVDGTTKEIVIDKSFFTDSENPTVLDTSAFATKLTNAVDKAFGAGKVDIGIGTGADLDRLTIAAAGGHTVNVSDGIKVGASKEFGTVVPGDLDDILADGTELNFKLSAGGESANLKIQFAEGDNLQKLVTKINAAINEAVKAEPKLAGVTASVSGDKLIFKNANGSTEASISNADIGEQLSSIFAGVPAGGVTMTEASSLHKIGITSGKSTAFDMSMTLAKKFGDSDGSKNYSFTINGKKIELTGANTMQEMMTAINQSGAGVKLSYDSFAAKFRLESNEAGATSNITFGASAENDSGKGFADIFNLMSINTATATQVATDAEFELDNVRTTRSTNTFTVNGMTITLNQSAQPTDGATSVKFDIELDKDTSAVLDLVKNFVSEYNKMIEYLNKETKTSRPKSDNYSYYEPLTDEEKKDLSDKDIELWEEKAKAGMLYRDDILQSITSQMRSTLYDAVTLSDGSKLSLFQVGITVSSKLSDQGKLVIDENKLIKMLETDGDAVAEMFTKTSEISSTDKAQRNARLKDEGIAERLNDIITWATNTSSPLNTRAGVGGVASESSSDMYKKIRAQESKISDMLVYLARRETYYYQMFSKLEAAMSQSDSQMAYLQSMMGL